jgi:hypothetical protein
MNTIKIADLQDPATEIDELAVAQVAEDGMRMHLRGADRDEAIRRMHGRIDTELIAWRLYITTRTVHRVIARSRDEATEFQPAAVAA